MRITGAIIVSVWLWSTTASAQAAAGAAPVPSPAPSVSAEPPPEAIRVDQARESFVTATGLAREGNWNDALIAFERSAELRPHPVTFYNIGYVERALGHYTRARSALRRALSQVDPDALPPDLAGEARGYLQEVESRIAHVTVEMRESLPVSVDGRPLEIESNAGTSITMVAGTRQPGPGEVPGRSRFELLIDPGSHLVVVGAGQGKESVSSLRVDPGVRGVHWRLSGPVKTAAHRSSPAKDAVHPSERTNGPRPWPFIAYGVGAAGLVVGTTFGILAMGEEADLQEQCGSDKVCNWEQRDAVDTFELHATLANVGFGIAVAGAALGTFLLFSEHEESPPRSSKLVTLHARAGPGSVRLSGEF